VPVGDASHSRPGLDDEEREGEGDNQKQELGQDTVSQAMGLSEQSLEYRNVRIRYQLGPEKFISHESPSAIKYRFSQNQNGKGDQEAYIGGKIPKERNREPVSVGLALHQCKDKHGKPGNSDGQQGAAESELALTPRAARTSQKPVQRTTSNDREINHDR
jgi:hypothetical protein